MGDSKPSNFGHFSTACSHLIVLSLPFSLTSASSHLIVHRGRAPFLEGSMAQTAGVNSLPLDEIQQLLDENSNLIFSLLEVQKRKMGMGISGVGYVVKVVDNLNLSVGTVQLRKRTVEIDAYVERALQQEHEMKARTTNAYDSFIRNGPYPAEHVPTDEKSLVEEAKLHAAEE
ncbi:hypothetical protein R1flu_028331 [Riccia fluitans]|uniref:Uncharacterized protein n=1 Tax=Riccia fluitans TaxID=41844 RepID=A0ABD1XLC8_9MARC